MGLRFLALDASTMTDELVEDVLALDRRNMTPVFEALGQPFPEARRRRGLAEPTLVMIAAFEGEQLRGYVEWCRDWRDADDVYLASIQVEASARGGMLFTALARAAMARLRDAPFRALTTTVQASNARMVAILRRLGFTLGVASASGSIEARRVN